MTVVTVSPPGVQAVRGALCDRSGSAPAPPCLQPPDNLRRPLPEHQVAQRGLQASRRVSPVIADPLQAPKAHYNYYNNSMFKPFKYGVF